MLAARRFEFAFLLFATEWAKIRSRLEIHKSRSNGNDHALGIGENVEAGAQRSRGCVHIRGVHVGPFSGLQACQQGLNSRDSFCRRESAVSGARHKGAPKELPVSVFTHNVAV